MTGNLQSASEPVAQGTSPAEPGELHAERPANAGNTSSIAPSHKRSLHPPAFLQAAVDRAAGVGQAIGSSVAKTGGAVVRTSVTVGSAIGNTASATGKGIVNFATQLGNSTFKQTHRLVEHATEGTGQAV